MKLKKIEEFSRYSSIVDRYKRKGCLTNDYLYDEAADLIIRDKLYEYCGADNAFLFVKKDGFYRVYYYLNDLEETHEFDLPDDFAVEILFRGGNGLPVHEMEYLSKCGFQSHLRRDQMNGIYSQLEPPVFIPNVRIEKAATIGEVAEACRLFNTAFDRYTGDFISDKEYELMLAEGQILMAYDPSWRFMGALHQRVERGVAWISHVAVVEGCRGHGVGHALIDAFVERNKKDEKSRYALWVQSKNESAVNMYTKKGFKYSNKSTISMLRLIKINN